MSEKCLLVDMSFMSHAVIPANTCAGNPRVQFHLNRRFLARRLLSETTGEGPLPDWKLARSVKKSGVYEADAATESAG